MANHILSPSESHHLCKFIELAIQASYKSDLKQARYALFRTLLDIKHFGFVLALTQKDTQLSQQMNTHLHALSEFFRLLEILPPKSSNTDKDPTLESISNNLILSNIKMLMEAGECLADQQEHDIQDHIVDSKSQMIEYWKECSEKVRRSLKEQVIIANKGKE